MGHYTVPEIKQRQNYMSCIMIKESCFTPYVNNKVIEQTARMRSMFSKFVVHLLDSIVPIVSVPVLLRLLLAS